MQAQSGLSAFLHRASSSKSYSQLGAAICDNGNVVPSSVWGWTRFGGPLRVVDICGRNAPDRFFSRYVEIGAALDPLLPHVLDRHIPVHNMQVSRDWDRHPFYRELFMPVGWKHVLHAPVVRDGEVAATLHYVRGPNDRPFDGEDLLTAFAVANHVSSLLARVDDEDGSATRLTKRELEMGRLVAAGLNNTEIGRCLGVSRNTVKGALKRVFRKLDVDARAEMAVRLSAAGLL